MVWTDGSLGLIEWKQINKFGHATDTRFENPDFVKLAQSFGATGIRVNEGDDLQKILKKAFKANKPVLIDCPVDYTENVKLTKRLGNLVCPI
jgi:acetolactate synthase-1/2/3 large subunit